MSRPRLRVPRLVALLAAASVTLVSVLGGLGVLPTSPAAAQGPTLQTQPPQKRVAPGGQDAEPARQRVVPPDASVAVPPGSGRGRRVVFAIGAQRVWLVEADGDVRRSYRVSGSVYDNLDPGRYAVYSRSEQAVGVDGSTMRYFVRFTHGARAAIGFHSIPLLDGRPVQSPAQLGTPLSHGCIRQRSADAVALWNFAPTGTPVAVVA